MALQKRISSNFENIKKSIIFFYPESWQPYVIPTKNEFGASFIESLLFSKPATFFLLAQTGLYPTSERVFPVKDLIRDGI